jgi:hypothetical protein
MTILWAGGEDTSFQTLLSMSVSTNTSYHRSAYAREAVGGTYGSAWPMTVAAVTPLWGPSSSFWVHGQQSCSATPAASGIVILALADSSGVGRILVCGTAVVGQLKISMRNAAGVLTDLVTSLPGTYTSTSPTKALDLFVNYAVAGQCTLYWDGNVIADTGPGVNVTTDGATTLSQAFFGGGNSVGGIYWSECAVRTTSTLGMSILTLPPVASGATQSWTPNTVADVNPTAITDANFVTTTAAGALSEWTVATALPPGTWSIAAVVQEARVSVGLTGPQHFEWLVRTVDGSDNVAGSVAPTGSFANYSKVWPLNPHTGVAWLPGDLIDAGVESLA